MLADLRQLKNTPREWRRFGWTVGPVLVLLGAGLAWRSWTGYPWLLIPGLALILLAAAAPRLLRWPYCLWMGLGLALGTIVSSILLTLFFYLVLTPIGLIARATGKDFLQRQPDLQAPTYWLKRTSADPPKPADYEKQF